MNILDGGLIQRLALRSTFLHIGEGFIVIRYLIDLAERFPADRKTVFDNCFGLNQRQCIALDGSRVVRVFNIKLLSKLSRASLGSVSRLFFQLFLHPQHVSHIHSCSPRFRLFKNILYHTFANLSIHRGLGFLDFHRFPVQPGESAVGIGKSVLCDIPVEFLGHVRFFQAVRRDRIVVNPFPLSGASLTRMSCPSSSPAGERNSTASIRTQPTSSEAAAVVGKRIGRCSLQLRDLPAGQIFSEQILPAVFLFQFPCLVHFTVHLRHQCMPSEK